MKLLVSELMARSRYVSREFAYIINELIWNYGWSHIETSALQDYPGSIKSLLLDRFGELPRVILFWEGYYLLNQRERELNDLDCYKAIFCDDLHWWDEQTRQSKFRAFSMCDVILSTYGYVFDRFYPDISRIKNVVWSPHSASTDFLLGYNERPENAVFLSGAVSSLYPLRQRMKELFDNGLHRIVYHQHPGYHCQYDYGSDMSVGQAYAKKIHACRVGFTDSLKYRYAVAKYFEIPATGSLLMADDAVSEPLKKIGFVEWVHYVSVSSEDLEDKIEYVLNEKNHDEMDEIRRRGQQLVLRYHKTGDRARLINEVCTQSSRSLIKACNDSGLHYLYESPMV